MYFAVELADGELLIAPCTGSTRKTAWMDITQFPAEGRWICGPHETRGQAFRALGKRQDANDADTAELVQAAGVPE